jgi:hypothetical protein
MTETLEFCVWKYVAVKAKKEKIENKELNYCREDCTGRDKNCSKYLPSQYKKWEIDYYGGKK